MRVGVVVMFTMLTYPVVKGFIPVGALTPLDLGVMIVAEIILGLLVGFMAQLVFMAAEFAGSIIGYQMGFAAANVFDPSTQQQVALVSQFQGSAGHSAVFVSRYPPSFPRGAGRLI